MLMQKCLVVHLVLGTETVRLHRNHLHKEHLIGIFDYLIAKLGFVQS